MVFSGIAEEIQTIVNKTSYTLNMIYLDEEENEVEQAIIQCRERKPLGILFLGGNPAFFREKFHEVKVPSAISVYCRKRSWLSEPVQCSNR